MIRNLFVDICETDGLNYPLNRLVSSRLKSFTGVGKVEDLDYQLFSV